jgi:hypothetical protein
LLCRRLPAGRRREEVIQALRPVAAEGKGSMAREEVVRALPPTGGGGGEGEHGEEAWVVEHGW